MEVIGAATAAAEVIKIARSVIQEIQELHAKYSNMRTRLAEIEEGMRAFTAGLISLEKALSVQLQSSVDTDLSALLATSKNDLQHLRHLLDTIYSKSNAKIFQNPRMFRKMLSQEPEIFKTLEKLKNNQAQVNNRLLILQHVETRRNTDATRRLREDTKISTSAIIAEQQLVLAEVGSLKNWMMVPTTMLGVAGVVGTMGLWGSRRQISQKS